MKLDNLVDKSHMSERVPIQISHVNIVRRRPIGSQKPFPDPSYRRITLSEIFLMTPHVAAG